MVSMYLFQILLSTYALTRSIFWLEEYCYGFFKHKNLQDFCRIRVSIVKAKKLILKGICSTRRDQVLTVDNALLSHPQCTSYRFQDKYE